jgi:tetratricopeptide (TPR) repeat protein
MTFRIISILLLLMTYSRGYSQFVMTKNVEMAWDHILELKPDSALRYLETEKLSTPLNPSSFYYSHYALFLQALISGDVSDYNRFNEEAEILTMAIRDSDPHHPEYLYFLSSMHLQKTFLNVYHGEFWQAIRDLYVARRMIRQNSQDWPGFIPNLKIAGIIELLISSVPENYHWIFNCLGMNAELQEAIGKLEKYYAICSPEDKPEALTILALAYGQILPDKDKAYKLLKECDEAFMLKAVSRLLLAFYASKTGHASEAAGLLEPANQPDRIWCDQAVLLLGITRLNMLEKDAGMYLEYFLDHYKGTNLVRIACHKLSWHYLIRGDTALYISYKQKVLSEGSDLLSADKQATAEASGNAMPDVQLLKARLLFDAGLYDRALEILHNINVNELESDRNNIEYTYRFARVCHELNMIGRAKELYLKVLSGNAVPDAYFAPYSALQLGLIAEQEGNDEEAKMFYETCLELNRGQYRSGIDREAKNRLESLKN